MKNEWSLHLAWLGLVLLTLAGTLAGESSAGALTLGVVVVGAILGKGWLVARHFLEVNTAHPLIRRLILAYIGLIAGLVVVVACFGPAIARLTALG